jgi:dihydrofolate synthase/folylpolyglutamate synthase
MNQMFSQSTRLYKKLQKRYSRKINLNLERITEVLNAFDNPHLKLKNPINILGSDGKMSVLTSLKCFIEADQKKTTAFTSPHLYDLRQRFWLKNKYISLNKIKKITRIIESKNLPLTLFELLTCIYIISANKIKNISYNLIESGLLFKKDSTNLWSSPRAQIVTNINFQHQDWIRPKTIEEICRQKVGYLSKKTIIYVAPQEPKVLKIIKRILKKNPSKIIYSSNWKIVKENNKLFYKDSGSKIPLISSNIKSAGLISNLGLAIKVALDLGIKKKTILKTIPKIKFEGRVQYIKKGKLPRLLHQNENLLIDGCHSEKSAVNLYQYLKSIKHPIYGVWGMQKNKLPERFLESFNKVFTKLITIPIPEEPNSLKNTTLKKIAEKLGYQTEIASNIRSALRKISNKKNKTIVVFGSLYLIGNVLSKN